MDLTVSVSQTKRGAAVPVPVVTVLETSASVGTTASVPKTAAKAVLNHLKPITVFHVCVLIAPNLKPLTVFHVCVFLYVIVLLN